MQSYILSLEDNLLKVMPVYSESYSKISDIDWEKELTSNQFEKIHTIYFYNIDFANLNLSKFTSDILTLSFNGSSVYNDMIIGETTKYHLKFRDVEQESIANFAVPIMERSFNHHCDILSFEMIHCKLNQKFINHFESILNDYEKLLPLCFLEKIILINCEIERGEGSEKKIEDLESFESYCLFFDNVKGFHSEENNYVQGQGCDFCCERNLDYSKHFTCKKMVIFS